MSQSKVEFSNEELEVISLALRYQTIRAHHGVVSDEDFQQLLDLHKKVTEEIRRNKCL